MRKPWATAALIVFWIVVIILLAGYSRNEVARRSDISAAVRATGGNPANARAKVLQYGCSSCHTIPGIPEAHGTVGPPLVSFAMRTYIAGEVANTPANLTHWIQHPHEIEPHTAMPEMGVTEQDSRDIAAYLYTLK
jgi:cytochrome c1